MTGSGDPGAGIRGTGVSGAGVSGTGVSGAGTPGGAAALDAATSLKGLKGMSKIVEPSTLSDPVGSEEAGTTGSRA